MTHKRLNRLIHSSILWPFFLSIERLSNSLVTLSFFRHIHLIGQMVTLIQVLSFVCTVICFMVGLYSCVAELVARYKVEQSGYGALRSLFHSIRLTLELRHFLKLHETHDLPTGSKGNPVNRAFNRAVCQSSVDWKSESVIVLIRLPFTQQAQALLNDRVTHIKEEITRQNSDYYFSTGDRSTFPNFICFEGKKR